MAPAKPTEPKGGWPMFFGFSHDKGGGKGFETALSAYARLGARCFLEVTADDLRLLRAANRGLPMLQHELDKRGKTHADWLAYCETGSYLQLVKWLDARRIRIIPLDKRSTMNVTENLKAYQDEGALARLLRIPHDTPVRGKEDEALYYMMSLVRERQWRHLLWLKARPKDMVVMHPGHLTRIRDVFPIPRARFRFIDRFAPMKGWRLPVVRRLSPARQRLEARIVQWRRREKRKRLLAWHVKHAQPHG